MTPAEWAQIGTASVLGAAVVGKVIEMLWRRVRKKENCELGELVKLTGDTLAEIRQLVALTREAQADHREMLVHLRRE